MTDADATPPPPQDGDSSQPFSNPASGSDAAGPPGSQMPAMPGSSPTGPPPAQPPTGQIPPPSQPAPGLFPPPAPGMAPGQQAPKRKKRWPWIAAAVFLLCGLPIAGLTALGIWGVGEFSERLDAIGDVADNLMLDASRGDQTAVATYAEGGPGCADGPTLASTVDRLNLEDTTFTGDEVRFVERSGDGELSFGPNADELQVDGRSNDSTALVIGTLDDGRRVEITLLKPSEAWRVCGIFVG